MKMVASEDAQLRCEHLPRPGAPALLLLNSLGTSLEMWDPQLAALSEHFELIRFDKRGHGKSTTGSRPELTMDQLARDALAVLDACGVARAHLCGLSIGGMTAMNVAAYWPDRVLKVVVASTAAHMPPRDTWDARIAAVKACGMEPLTDGILSRWFTPEFRAAEPQQIERVRAMLLQTDRQGYTACAAAVRDMDQRESIKSITARTLVIGGSKDPSTTPAHAQSLAQSIPEAKRVMLDCAHLANIERAAEFTRTLLDFLTADALPASEPGSAS
jgi:3-oxoadipate enol-lactonase